MTVFRDRIARLFFVVAAILLVFSVVIMSAQIVLRVIFNQPLIWPEEVVRYLFVWVVYLGTVVGVIRDTHIRVLVAVEPFGERGRRVSDWITRVINAFCFGYLTWWGVDLALKYQYAEFYTLPGWPQVWFYYLALPLSAALCFLFTLLPGAPRSDHAPPSETSL